MLIGDIPYGRWNSYVTDYCYMDLDSNWIDSNDDGTFEIHDTSIGDAYPEIWVGRLMASTIDDYRAPASDEVGLINHYFDKNHNFRNPSARTPNFGALAFIDTEMSVSRTRLLEHDDGYRGYDEQYVGSLTTPLQNSFIDVNLVGDQYLNGTETKFTDYKSCLESGDGYELTWVVGHGSGIYHGFATASWNDAGGYWQFPPLANEGGAHYHYYLSDNPKTYFYIFYSCGLGYFPGTNTVANSAVFGGSPALVAIGMTVSAGEDGDPFADFFDDIKEHHCIGEAFKSVYTYLFDTYGQDSRTWWVLLGDPTIRLDQAPYAPAQPDGVESGYAGVTFWYDATTTDMNDDDIWYQFDWDDNTNPTTVGPYSSGEQGSAHHAWMYPGSYDVKVRAKDDPYEVWGEWSQPLEVTITSPPPGGCPTLYAWNGSAYIDYGVINIHSVVGEDVIEEVQVKLEDVAINQQRAQFRLREGWPDLTFSESFVDQIKLYAVDVDGNLRRCPLIGATHSSLGNVLPQLVSSDERRVQLSLLETVDLTFLMPSQTAGTQGYVFVIEGHNPHKL